MALTIKEIENAKPLPKKYKMADGGGLCLLVAPSGAKLWVWRYRFNGAEKICISVSISSPKNRRSTQRGARSAPASGSEKQHIRVA